VAEPNDRKHIPKRVETTLLAASRRRCCLCAYLRDDWDVKAGQIAHIDQDRTNNKLENLAWLCLEHHDEYDSRTSQSKNITDGELTHYRDKLVDDYASAEAAEKESEPAEPYGFEIADTKLRLLWTATPTIFHHLHESRPALIEYLIEDPVHFEEGCFEPLGERRASGDVLHERCPRCDREIYDGGGRVVSGGRDYYMGLYLDDLKHSVFREIRRLHKMGTDLRGRIECDAIRLPDTRGYL
jgi:hypothetical protein